MMSNHIQRAEEINLCNLPPEIIEIIIQNMANGRNLKVKLSFAETNSHYRDLVMSHLNHNDFMSFNRNRIITVAAELGLLNVLKYAHEKGYPWGKKTFEVAAKNGHLEILKYLHINGCPRDPLICSRAIISRNLACLLYVHENVCPWGKGSLANAAESRPFKCLKYSRRNRFVRKGYQRIGCKRSCVSCEEKIKRHEARCAD